MSKHPRPTFLLLFCAFHPAYGHDFSLATELARVNPVPSRSDFAPISAREGAYLQSLTDRCTLWRSLSTILINRWYRLLNHSFKKRNWLYNSLQQMRPTKMEAKYFDFKTKTLQTRVHCRLRSPVATYPDPSSSTSLLSLASPEFFMILSLQDIF